MNILIWNFDHSNNTHSLRSTKRTNGLIIAKPFLLSLNLVLRTMSYYSPHTTGSYPYSGYHHTTTTAYPGHPQTGAYPTTAYQTPYATGVQGYGTTWPYPYGYYQQPATAQQQQQQQTTTTAVRPVTATPVATTSTANTQVAPTPTATTHRVQPVQTTYTYVPRETIAAAGSGGARGRKHAMYRGLFAKECKCRS